MSITNKALMKAPPQIPIELPEVFPDEGEAVEALRRCGMTEISKGRLTDYKTIGLYIQGAGVVKTMRGSIMITHQRLDAAMRLVYEEMLKVRDFKGKNARVLGLARLSHELGYLASRQADTLKSILSLDGGKPPANGDGDFTPTARSFAPGSEVKPNQTLITGSTVYVNSGQAPSTAK